MDGLEKLDHTHAIYAGFNSVWRRLFAFFGVALLAHFAGGNIYGAPGFINAVRTRGFSALDQLQPFDLVWLPLAWLGTLLMSFNHPWTWLYVAALAYSFLATMRGDDVPRWAIAVLIVGQPIDTFCVLQFDSHLSGTDLGIAGALLGIYTALAIGGCYAWWRVREDHA